MDRCDPIRVRCSPTTLAWGETLIAALQALDIDTYLDPERIRDHALIDLFDFRVLAGPAFVLRVLPDHIRMTWIMTPQRAIERGMEHRISSDGVFALGGFWSFGEYGPNEPGTSAGEAAQVIAHALTIAYADTLELSPEYPPATQAYASQVRARQALTSTHPQYQEALAACDHALALEPNNIVHRVTKGTILREMKQYPKALSVFDAAITLNPQFSCAYYSRGLTFIAMGRHADAVAAYERATSLNAAVMGYWEELGRAHWRLGNLAGAIAAFDHAIALCDFAIDFDMHDLWHNKAKLLQALGRHEDALIAFDHSIEHSIFRNPRVWHGRGISLRALGHYDDALTAFNHALLLDKTNLAVWDDEIALLEQLGHHAQAQEARNQRDHATLEGQARHVP